MTNKSYIVHRKSYIKITSYIVNRTSYIKNTSYIVHRTSYIRLLVFILYSFSVAVLIPAHAQYRIESLNGDYITYLGRQLGVGATFEHKDSIVWKNSTTVYARNTRTRNVERLREADFTQNKQSFWNYFIKINHGSNRACEDYCLCSLSDNTYFLSDTIRFRTDEPEIVDYFLGFISLSDMPDCYLSYQLNGKEVVVPIGREEDLLVITKSAFPDLKPQQHVLVTLYSISRSDQNSNSDQRHIIADHMLIEIL